MKDLNSKELERLQAVRDLRVLDTEPDPVLDGITRAAAALCEVPVSLVSIVDLDRQWFKSQCGIDVAETARDVALCSYAILSDEPLEVQDTLEDQRFKSNPLVTGPPHIRFYFGVPLVGSAGYRYGTLCVIDFKPRDLKPSQKLALRELAKSALRVLESSRERDQRIVDNLVHAQTLATLPSAVVTCLGHDDPVELNDVAISWFGMNNQGMPLSQWYGTHELILPDSETGLSLDDHPLQAARSGTLIRNRTLLLRIPGSSARVVNCSANTIQGPDGLVRGAVMVMNDITQMHTLVGTLAEERRRLATIIEGTRAGTWEWNLQSGEMRVNDRWADVVGYTLKELEPFTFDLWERLIHFDDVEKFRKALKSLDSEMPDFDIRYRVAHKDGHWVWVHDRGRVHQWAADGVPLAISGTRLDISDLKVIEEKARLETEKFSGAFESAAHGIAMVSLKGAWIDVNPALCHMLGYSREELLATNFQSLTHKEDLDKDLELLQEVLAGIRRTYQMDKRYFCKDGSFLWGRLSVSLVHDADGHPLHFVSLIQDVTAERVAKAQLIEKEQHTRTILESVGDAILLVDAKLKIKYANSVALTLLGVDIAEILEKRILDVLVLRNEDGKGENIDMSKLSPAFAGSLSQKSDLVVQSQGRQIPVSIMGTPLGEDEHPDILLVIHDTSAERQRSLNSDLLAQIDPLTELANRRGFERAIEDTIASASKHSSLALIDLDEFKGINDTHGHAAGDALLREVAKRLKSAIRKDDVAARIGGDEFALVLPGCPKHRAIEISEHVRSLIQDMAIPWEESQLTISVSVGVAIFESGIDQESLMSAADDACYQAKRAGKNRVVVVQI